MIGKFEDFQNNMTKWMNHTTKRIEKIEKDTKVLKGYYTGR